MKINEYISDLRNRKNVVVTVSNGEVKISGNKQALTDNLIADIRSRKKEIIAYFDSLRENEPVNIFRAVEKDYYKLSSAQKRLYFIYEMDKQSIAYNQPLVVKLEGRVNKEKIQAAFDRLVTRHEMLRTSFVVLDGEVFQQIHQPRAVKIEYYSSGPDGVQALIQGFVRPFDLTEASLLRVGLIEISAEEFILMTDTHHIVCDGVSQSVLIGEFMAFHQGKELLPLPLQYKDYAEWQNSEQLQRSISAKKQFWLEQFSKEPAQLELPVDYPRPSKRKFAGALVEFSLGEKETTRLKLLAEKNGVTLFTALLSVLKCLLHKLTNAEDIVIGTPTSGREHSDLESVIGVFVNTLALRSYPNGSQRFLDFMSSVKSTTLACFDNQAYQYETLINELKVQRDASRNPLFDVMFTYQNYERPSLEIPGLKLKPYACDHNSALFDIHLTAFESERTVEFNFSYQKELFKRETIERFISYFRRVVSVVTDNPDITLSEIEVMSEEEKNRIVNLFNRTRISFPKEETVVSLFEKQASKTPDNIALRFEEETITYRELEERSRLLAVYLQKKGVTQETLVGICMERSIEMIVTMLGISRAGGAYVPIDPQNPYDRISYLVEDSVVKGNEENVKLLITQQPLLEALRKSVSKHVTLCSINPVWAANEEILKVKGDIKPGVSPDQLVYVIYTSGSTGQSKGVMVEHRNVVSLLKNENSPFDFNDKDVWTMFHSYSFDFSVWEMYGALLSGAALVIVSKDTAKDPRHFAKLLYEKGVTVLNQTPIAFYMLQDAYVSKYPSTSIRYVIFGGEALSPARLRPWYTAYKNSRLVNMYGITETTVHSTYKDIQAQEINSGISNIGTALCSLGCFILDPYMKPAPIGVSGELYVSGAGVARGYLNQPELTRSRFIRNPLTGDEGSKWYRSGDLARWLPDGDMEYLGRIDTQVKIRGFRIELGEIEAALNDHQSISKSVVIARDHDGSKQLIAYCVPAREDTNLVIEEVRSFLMKTLPDYMVPAFIVPIKEIPVTSNGKVDRRSLQAKELSVSSAHAYVAPVTEIERLSAEVWKEVLSIPKIGIKDNFFTLGGDSIKAIKLVYKINEILHCDLNVADVYAHQTIEALSALIPNRSAGGNDAYQKAVQEVEAFQQWYKDHIGVDDSVEAVYPMSGIEKGMSFYTLLKDKDEESFDNIYYHEQNIYSIPFKGFDFGKFKRAIHLLMEKHNTLRKVYDVDNFAHIIKKQMDPELHYIDISHLSMQEQQEFGLQNKDRERVRATDFSGTVPLWRMSIVKTREDYHYLLFDMHHSVLDGWSLYAFLTELKNTYVYVDKDPDYIPEKLRCSYYDHIVSEFMETASMQSYDYWRKELADYNRFIFSKTGSKHQYVTKIYNLDLELRNELKDAASRLNTTLKHLCFAAYIYTLSKFSYENDFVVGIITNSRPPVPDGEKLLGCFLNAVPFRVDVSNATTWRDYIAYIQDKLVKMKPHERIPLHKILEVIEEPAFGGNPLFDTSFNFIDFWIVNDMLKYEAENEIDHHSIEDMDFANDNIDVHQNTLFDFHIWSDIRGFQMIFEYSTTVMNDELIQKFRRYFVEILRQFITNADGHPSHHSILLPAEEYQLLNEFNDTEVNTPGEETVVSLFENQVSQTPDKLALKFSGGAFTYRQLNEMSKKVARYLTEVVGVRAGDLVGVMLEREAYLIPSILGVMATGAAYVPIDPNHPAERVSLVIEDAALKALITRGRYSNTRTLREGTRVVDLDASAAAIEALSPAALSSSCSGSDLAYVIYTSGSTGKPKGVMIAHSSVVNFIDAAGRVFPLHKASVMLSLTTISFDIFVLESLVPLSKGLTVVLGNEREQVNARLLTDAIRVDRVDALQLTPSRLELLLEEADESTLQSVKILMVGGEAFPERLFYKLRNIYRGDIFNLYGPTETTVYSTIRNLTNENSIDIGKPVANTQVYILNKHGELLSRGIAGELCIGGKGLARGYFKNPELTQSKFAQNPFRPGERIYKTGDFARWLPDGNLECLGRMDNQVKIRGFRIELGDIENAMRRHPSIREALVLTREDSGEKSLVAYYVPAGILEGTELRDYLSEKLPDYMLPSYYIHLREMPLTPNGKVNKKALPSPTIVKDENYKAPSGKIEESLVRIWSEVLKVDREVLSTTKNFFQLGGTSLKAITLINRVNTMFDINCSLKEIFDFPNVRELAFYIENFALPEGSDALKQSYQQDTDFAAVEEQYHYPVHQKQRGKYCCYLVMDKCKNPLFDAEVRQMNMALVKHFDNIGENVLLTVLTELITRHYALRTVFLTVDNELRQRVLPEDDLRFSVQRYDLRKFPDPEKEAEDHCNAIRRHTFDFEKGPLFRSVVMKLSDEKHIVLMVLNHVIADGYSLEIIKQDFEKLLESYSGVPSLALEANLPVFQSKDVFKWELDNFTGERGKFRSNYWRQHLKGFNNFFLLKDYYNAGASMPRESSYSKDLTAELRKNFDNLTEQEVFCFKGAYHTGTSREGSVCGFAVSGDLFSELKRLVGVVDTSLFPVVLSSLYLLLFKLTGKSDLVIGYESSYRSKLYLNDLVAWMSGTTIMRHKLDQHTLLYDMIQSVNTEVQLISDRYIYPFDRILSENDFSVPAIGSVYMNYLNYFFEPGGRIEDDTRSFSDGGHRSYFDIDFTVQEFEDALKFECRFRKDLFTSATIDKVIDLYVSLLQQIISGNSKVLYFGNQDALMKETRVVRT